MIFRKALLATTMLMVPLAVEAQTANEPVTGVYVGAAGGFNIKVNPNINNITSNIPGAGGLNTPNANFSTGIGAAAAGALGYGLGNGMRIELSWDWMNNSFSRTSTTTRVTGVGLSTGASGHENVWGPMVNFDYDFYDLVPQLVPYLGIGLGYQWAALNDFSTTGTTPAGNLATISSGDKRASFAAQGIVGAAYRNSLCAGPGAYRRVSHLGIDRNSVPTMRDLRSPHLGSEPVPVSAHFSWGMS